MKKLESYSIGIQVLVLILIGYMAFSNSSVSLGGVSNFDSLHLKPAVAGDNALEVENNSGTDQLVVHGAGGVTISGTSTISGASTISGEARIAGLRRTGSVATLSTSTPPVVTAAQVCGNPIWNQPDWTGRASSTDTVTLPSAGDVFSDCLTTNGDSFGPILFVNSASAAASTTLITAGASSTLIGVDGNADVINGGNKAYLNFHRYSATEMVVEVREATDAD